MKRSQTPSLEQYQRLTTSAFGYDLLRKDLLEDILGKEYSAVLYWSGKSLARKYPLESTEEIIAFFSEAGWGQLELVSQGKHEMTFQLTSELISSRFENGVSFSYQLEAGFLAEQLQQSKKMITEAMEQQKKKTNSIQFIVQWDKKDSL